MAKSIKRFADDGWAMWVGGDDTSTFYIDQWVNFSGKSFVDVGVAINDIKDTSYLSIYVPFALEKNEIQDLSTNLANPNIFKAVFNTTCLFELRKNEHTSEMAYNGRVVDVVHIETLDYAVTPLASGTLIRIPFDDLLPHIDNERAYFLFRVPHKSLDEALRPDATPLGLFKRLRNVVATPVLVERYGCSIRINEARMLPAAVTNIGFFHRQKLSKVVVSLILRGDYQLTTTRLDRVRRLERDLYEKHAPEGFGLDDYIVYYCEQTREDNARGHFNFYFDICREKISSASLLVYIFVVYAIGLLTNISYEFLRTLLF